MTDNQDYDRPTHDKPTDNWASSAGDADGRTRGDKNPDSGNTGDTDTDSKTTGNGTTGNGTIDNRETDDEATGSRTGADGVPVADGRGERPRRRLFRRNRSADPEAEPKAAVPRQRTSPERDQGAIPAKDEEYVDWVTGLAKPAPPQSRPVSDEPLRSLRSPGRPETG